MLLDYIKFNKFLFLLVIFLNPISKYSQETFVYLDEYSESISHEEFQLKLDNIYFLDQCYELEGISYKKLIYTAYFGTLETSKKDQIQKLLYKRYQLDSTKIWVIRIVDTLPDTDIKIESESNEFEPIYDKNNTTTALKRNRVYDKNEERSLQDCDANFKLLNQNAENDLKRYTDYKNANLFHFYKINKGSRERRGIIHWHKDPYRILSNTFRNGSSSYRNIILYPNGDYFVSLYKLPIDMELNFLNKSHYMIEKRKFVETIAVTD